MSRTGDTIQRCPHDEENPYTQILNALIRDNNISPNCRMIIIFLLSNKNNWTIRIPQLISEFKKHLGKDAIYKIINEAIEAGYILREEYTENNLKRYKYYLSEKPKFKKCFLHPEFQDTGAPDPEKPDSKERTCKEKTSKERIYKQEDIIAPCPSSPKTSAKAMPAGGNNNFFKCLDKCTDLSDRQKRLLMKYPEHLVEQAVRYCYHHTTQIKGGPIGRIKLLQYFLNNPDDFKEQMQNLDKPLSKLSKKDILLGRFKNGEVYNGYEYSQDDIGVGFYKSGMYQPYSVHWDALNFANDFIKLLNKLGIKYE